jgi:uncharacterized membrane protein YeaQ/YmgE (transglycosylase-associated protein family)
MGIIVAVIVGLIAGALARFLAPGRDPGGFLVTVLLGMAGSLLAYVAGRMVGWYVPPGDGPGVVASTIGALVLLGAVRAANPKRLKRLRW